jgi:hypothetical protein
MRASRRDAHKGLLRVGAACAAPAVFVALTVLLPALEKAFTIDDVTFLLQAKHVLADPLHPTAFEMVFDGTRLRLSRELVTGPVMAYLLVPSVLLGGAEWAAHAIQIVLLGMAAVATAALTLRLGGDRRQATTASLLVVSSPAVLGMAATAMPDVPAMAFVVAGMERLVAWKHTRSRAAGLVAALFFALAALSRPHTVLVLACGSVWLMPDAPARLLPRRLWTALTNGSLTPVVMAVAMILGVVLLTRDPMSGDTIASATAGRVMLNNAVFNLASFAQHWAVAFPLAVLWPVLRKRGSLHLLTLLISFDVGILLGAAAGYFGGEAWRSVPVLLLVSLSAAVFVDILHDAYQQRDRVHMVLWLWLLIAIPTATYVHLPPKMLVPSAPAMAILLALQLPPANSGRSVPRLLPVVCAACLVLGVLIIRADSALAEIGRAGGAAAKHEVGTGRRVWMDGAWGFQWYAMAAGAEPLAETGPFPQAGDVVVAGLRARGLARSYPYKTLTSRQVYAEPGGRVDGEGAGFFTNWAGPWPWTWGRGEVGRIEVWRIDSLPQIAR